MIMTLLWFFTINKTHIIHIIFVDHFEVILLLRRNINANKKKY